LSFVNTGYRQIRESDVQNDFGLIPDDEIPVRVKAPASEIC